MATTQLGIGVMISRLLGGRETPEKYLGKTITKAEIVNDRIVLSFDDGVEIEIWDNGQSCCEHRYITCDDDLSILVGGKLKGVEIKKCETMSNQPPEDDDYYDDSPHEVCFVEISTDKNFISFCTHNQHNGFYGGFALVITEVGKEY